MAIRFPSGAICLNSTTLIRHFSFIGVFIGMFIAFTQFFFLCAGELNEYGFCVASYSLDVIKGISKSIDDTSFALTTVSKDLLLLGTRVEDIGIGA